MSELSSNSSKIKKTRPKWKYLFLYLFLLIICFSISSMYVIVSENELVIVERMGKVVAVYDQQQDKGFHGKLPWPIESVTNVFKFMIHQAGNFSLATKKTLLWTLIFAGKLVKTRKMIR